MMKTVILLSALLLSACGHRPDAAASAMEALSVSSTEPSMGIAPVEDAGPETDGTEVDGIVRLDKTVHDFGDISVSDGPVSCTFTVTNIGPNPIAILEVTKTCGCTEVNWTKEPIQPGKEGKVEITYANSDGAIPFEKTASLYIAGLSKRIILKYRGVVHEKIGPLKDLYPVHLGNFALKSTDLRAGNLEQGESKSEQATVANIGKKALKVSFTDLSPQLAVRVEPNPIPAGETAKILFTVKADRNLWGSNDYHATAVVDGKEAGVLNFTAVTKENFASWTEQQRADAAYPLFDQSTYAFGTLPAGSQVEAVFTFTNKGKDTVHFYKVDSDHPLAEADAPDTAGGKKGSVRVLLDTSSMEKGENVVMLTLFTNSPVRPVVNLFIVGILQ